LRTEARMRGSPKLSQAIRVLRRLLGRVGREDAISYPWHGRVSVFHLLLAEFYLRRTTRKVVARVFPLLRRAYPTASRLALGNPAAVWRLTRPTGLRNRSYELIRLARAIVSRGRIGSDHDEIESLPSVGPYIADAILLYGLGHCHFPLDENVRRVLVRATRGSDPKANPRPYQDMSLVSTVRRLILGLPAESVKNVHRGILHVGWKYCRADPLCPECPLLSTCEYSRARPRRQRDK